MEQLLETAFPGETVRKWISPSVTLEELRRYAAKHPNDGFHPENSGGLYLTFPRDEEVLYLVTE